MIFIVTGILAFATVMIISMGAMSHLVPSDTDIIADNLAVWCSAIAFFVSIAGALISLAKGIVNFRKS
jgi:hypothetical protein